MKLPEGAQGPPPVEQENNLPGVNEAYIHNPVADRKLLTRQEALNTINVLSAIMLADGAIRRH